MAKVTDLSEYRASKDDSFVWYCPCGSPRMELSCSGLVHCCDCGCHMKTLKVEETDDG